MVPAVVERGVDWTTAAVVANVRSCRRRNVILVIAAELVLSMHMEVNGGIGIMKCTTKRIYRSPGSSFAS